jgi:hypothetical protein
MSSRRRAGINRDAAYDDEETPSLTLKDADAALYGALSRVDNKRKAIERTRFGAFKITPCGLEIGDGAEQKDWEEAGQFIFQVDSGIQWTIGDWLAYGLNLQYGDIPKLADRFGRDEKTLHHYKQICEKFEFTRRRVDLTFGHHEAVRALTSYEQDQALAYAAEQNLSVAALRKLIKGETSPALPSGLDTDKSYKAMKRLSRRDPATLKPEEREEAHLHLLDLERWIKEMRIRIGIE